MSRRPLIEYLYQTTPEVTVGSLSFLALGKYLQHKHGLLEEAGSTFVFVGFVGAMHQIISLNHRANRPPRSNQGTNSTSETLSPNRHPNHPSSDLFNLNLPSNFDVDPTVPAADAPHRRPTPNLYKLSDFEQRDLTAPPIEPDQLDTFFRTIREQIGIPPEPEL